MSEPSNTVNLSDVPAGGKVTKHGERYRSMGECSKKRCIPREVLAHLDNLKMPEVTGIRIDGAVHWEKTGPYLRDNYNHILTQVKLSEEKVTTSKREKLELEKLAEEVKKLRNFNKERDGEYINRELVLTTLKEIVSHHTTTLRRWLEHEQPTKCDGMSAVQLKVANQEIVDQLLKELTDVQGSWEQRNDITEETQCETTLPPTQ